MRKLYDTDMATESWYSNVRFYNYNHPGHNDVAKPFVKLVWNETKVVGFGISGRYVVAKYCRVGENNPNPNYEKNVLPIDACKEH